MKRKLLVFFIVSLIGYGGYSQTLSPSVIAAEGGTSKGESIQLEWTLGEAAVQTISSPDGVITEGFHQPSLIVEPLEPERHVPTPETETWENLQIVVAPNPVRSTLKVQVASDEDITAQVQIVDLNGTLLQQFPANLSLDQKDVDLSSYPSGTYLLYFRKKSGELIKTFKITKIN